MSKDLLSKLIKLKVPAALTCTATGGAFTVTSLEQASKVLEERSGFKPERIKIVVGHPKTLATVGMENGAKCRSGPRRSKCWTIGLFGQEVEFKEDVPERNYVAIASQECPENVVFVVIESGGNIFLSKVDITS